MKPNQPDYTDNILQEFAQHLRRDADMQELPLTAQKELWNRIEQKNRYYDKRIVRLMIWSSSVAAAICLLIMVTWFKLPSPQLTEFDYASVMQNFEHVVQTDGNVQLVLSKNQKIAIDGQEAQLHYEDGGWVNINKNDKISVKEHINDGQMVFNQLIVPVGKRSMLTLNDGTRIWINSGSKLVYPAYFGQNKREVFIEGEIFLDVSPDEKRPFIVRTSTLDVKVIGTRFNVSAYADRFNMQIVLVSGTVEIQEKGDSKEILKPNQMFLYNEKTHESCTSIVDVTDYIVWKDGYYSFFHQDLETVLSKLSKYYDVHFTLDQYIKELSFSGKLDLKEDLQEVFRMMEKTAPIEIQKITERKYKVIVKH